MFIDDEHIIAYSDLWQIYMHSICLNRSSISRDAIEVMQETREQTSSYVLTLLLNCKNLMSAWYCSNEQASEYA